MGSSLAAAQSNRPAEPPPVADSAAPPPAMPASEAISLGDIVGALLANNTDLKLAGADSQLAQGNLLVAAEPFDTALGTAVSGNQERTYTPASDDSTRARQVTFTAGMSKRLRAGVVVTPEVSSSRTTNYSDPRLTVGEATARLKVLIPLLRDRAGILTRGPEESARRFHAAALLEERHAAALGVMRAATAYWDFLAARRRLDVFISSESRAERTSRETAALVQADERTKTDRVQADGHLAARRSDRLTAELDVVTAWDNLATVIGVVRQDMSALPGAGTDFPSLGQEPSGESLSRWLRAAEGRDDLQAARLRLEGAEVGHKAQQNELLPRLDLEVGGGWKGQERDREWDRFFSPLVGSPPGADVSAQLRFELPIIRSGPRGRLTQAVANYERQRVLRTHVERAMRNGVTAAFATVRHAQLSLRQSEAAVRLLSSTVDSERQKFRLGFSTLLDVIQAEESLTTALLSRISAQRSFAAALARLRFETGTILAASGDGQAPSSGAALAAALVLLP